MKKTLLLTSFLLLFFQNKLFAIESIYLPREFTCDGFKLYNSLSEVELADLKLQESGLFEQFLTEAQKLARRYKLKGMGVRLVHRHTDIDKNQIMIEKHEYFNGKTALVTRPYSKTHENHAIPASWIFDGKGYRVFEYSYDAHVRKIFEKVRNLPEFLIEFATLLKKYDYQNLLALAIIDREWYKDYADNQLFLEESYDEPSFASVVINVDEKDVKAIETAWTFKKVSFDSSCKSICASTSFGHKKTHSSSI